MIISILTFDFYQAFRFNPFLFILFPFFLLCFIDEMIILIFDSDGKFTKKIPDKIYYCLLILTLIFGVLRNIPFFDYLIPTYI